MANRTPRPPPIINEREHYNAKPPIFDGERFYYSKDRIKIFFLGYDVDLWDIIVDGYKNPVDARGNKVERRSTNDQQKKKYKNHHKARTILLNAISYMEYEKITNRDSNKSIFDYLRMTREGNAQVKETKALALIPKYEAFKMEDNETIENMFSRFKTLVVGLNVLNKGYSTLDHVKKIIKSLPTKWRPMLIVLKLAKDLNNTSLEELISSLRIHEIELEQDEPHKKGKSVALKCTRKSEKPKAFQGEEEEDSSENSDEDEDEPFLLSRRVNQLWKRKQGNKFKGARMTGGRFESTYRLRKFGSSKEVTCYECKESGHYKNECQKIHKENPNKKFFKGNKKGLMATWDDSDSSEDDSEEEQANVALVANIIGYGVEIHLGAESELDSDIKEELQIKFKELKKVHESVSEKHSKLKEEFSILNEENIYLKDENSTLKSMSSTLEKEIPPKVSESTDDVISKYDKAFQKFLARSIGRSMLASMIYCVSKNVTKGISYDFDEESDSEQKVKPNVLHSHFVLSGCGPKTKPPPKPKVKPIAKMFRFNSCKYVYFAPKPKVFKNSGKSNKKGPKKLWVSKKLIIYVADILSSKVKTPVMVPVL
ncbi:uncharacterized protein LOC131627789 [Vicia villosa]|uniref:uncharacterized protein LOC131627789 n=1 Tax=Vicia villosa TaxID=3911 RepID=UPI00273AD67D|nr:uncharacterized protein LOC131627789 [Vicia villosa]